MKLYFAHPLTDYDTFFEASCRGVLAEFAPGFLCPNGPEHDAAYKAEGWPYFDRLVETCDAVAFVRVPDGRVSAGVAKEVESFFRRGLPVFEIERRVSPLRARPVEGMPGPVMTIDETRAFIRRTRAVRGAVDAFQAVNGIHKASIVEIMEEFGELLFDRLAAEAETRRPEIVKAAVEAERQAIADAVNRRDAFIRAIGRRGGMPSLDGVPMPFGDFFLAVADDDRRVVAEAKAAGAGV